MATSVAGSLNLITVLYFYSFKLDTFDVPLGTIAVSHLRPRFAYILGKYGHAQSQGGRNLAAAFPPLYVYIYKVPLRDVCAVKSRG